jgi:hypothetical protein
MKSDELDKILDTALASYSQEEPRQGLDYRVLNRIHASRDSRRFAWLRWAIAIPAFACLVVLALTFWNKGDSTPKPLKPASLVTVSRPRLKSLQSPKAKQVVVWRGRSRRLREREQFPTPTPLTDQERALLAFVTRSPKQAQEVLADAKSRSTEPIQIKEIQIEPLQDGGQ